MEKLTDTDLMPIGKQYLGKAMANVPEDYLLWFWGEKFEELRAGLLYGDTLLVMLYIEDNLNVD